MKVQDIALIFLLVVLLISPKRKFLVWVALGLYLLAIPLYLTRIFFTAEQFVWYATVYILVHTVLLLGDIRKDKKNL